MKLAFLFFFLFIFSCSTKDENLIDLDFYKNQGKKIILFAEEDFSKKNINSIKKISVKNFVRYNNWSQKNQNLNNLIQAYDFNISKKIDNINVKINDYIIYNEKIFLINNKSELIVYDLDFKKLISKKIYKRKIYNNYNLKFSISGYENKIFISDNLGNLICLSSKNLDIIWEKSYGVPFKSDVKIYKKNLYVINSNSKLYSIDAENGELNWSFETSSKYLKDKNSYQIAIFDNKLFFTNDSFEIYSVDLKSKNILWSLTFGKENFNNLPILFLSSPITIDKNGDLFVSTNNGYTYKINASNGVVKWSTPIYSTNRFLVTNKYLINTYHDRVFLINKLSGKILLNKKISNNKKKFIFKNVVVNKNSIYLFDKNGHLIFINKNDLSEVSFKKNFKNYKDQIFYKNNLYIDTTYSIEKY